MRNNNIGKQMRLSIKEIAFADYNGYDNIYLTIDKCSEEVIFSKEKWLNDNELLWVRIYADGLADYGLTKMEDPFHGGKYTWSSRAAVINSELLKGTRYALIRSDIGVKELESKYSNSYASMGVCASVIIPIVEKCADKMHYSLEEFKQRELRYI